MNLLENESLLRISFFASGLFIFWLVGLLTPYRKPLKTDPTRWLNNLSLVILNTLVVRLLFPFTLVWWAHEVFQNNWGLFHWLKLGELSHLFLSILVLDGVIYFQHRVFHNWSWLWQLHRVHHSDTNFDVTTALRFHPIEIVLSIFVKGAAILVLGVSPTAVIIFEILLNFSAMFNHGNFSLPKPIETLFRSLIVTPDMHRIHHSTIKEEINSNYGFFLSIWDRLFKTYVNHSRDNLKKDKIGVDDFRTIADQRLDQLILQPLKRSSK